MPKRLRPQLTFANVVSCLALFVALGGSAYAVKQLPKNSVGTPQLKRGAVTKQKVRRNAVNSAKVKNHSLQAVDFKAGQLPAGPPGPKGDPGPAGASATGLWADVAAGEPATVRHGEGVTSVEKKETGVTIVTFNRNVDNCSYQVTPTYRSSGYWLPDSTATVTISPEFYETGGNRVAVVSSQNELLVSFDFSIAVFC